MRISDWSSDVCSSDLRGVRAIRRFTVRPVLPEPLQPLTQLATNLRWSWHPPTQDLFAEIDPEAWRAVQRDPVRMIGAVEPRSEERRVGKEWVCTGRSRWSPYH